MTMFKNYSSVARKSTINSLNDKIDFGRHKPYTFNSLYDRIMIINQISYFYEYKESRHFILSSSNLN